MFWASVGGKGVTRGHTTRQIRGIHREDEGGGWVGKHGGEQDGC